MKKILITGFGDWAGSSANPAKFVANALNGTSLAGAVISTLIAPSIFNEMAGVVTKEIDRTSPEIVIMLLGEFCGRSMITVERLAQNLIGATRCDTGDASGSRPQDIEVVPAGPAAYYATLPIRTMVKAMRHQGIPSDISDTAGTFGCNPSMYGVLHHIAQSRLPIRAGWIHLSSLPVTAVLEVNLGMPSMLLDTQIDGLKAAVAAVAENEKDIDAPIRSQWQ